MRNRISQLCPLSPRASVQAVRALVVLFCLCSIWNTSTVATGAVRAPGGSDVPNIVLILADDLGWADLGCYGNRFHDTPDIDRLAREGLRFTQFYAGAVCSPTRANMQSGQDHARFGITQHIPGHRRPFAKLIDPEVPRHLPLEVETFAERLSAVGYKTGYFGKWHLGGEGYGPGEQGWQTYVECQGNTVPPRLTGGVEMRTAEFLTQQAEQFIASHRDHPFLLQVSHYAVHIPLSTTPELLAKYRAKPPQPGYPSLPEYGGLLEELDQSVGRIVAAVETAGLSDRTLVVFLSDNGGLEHEQGGRVVTSNQPLRGEKGTLYEGGVRVPAIFRWPGRIPAGIVRETPAITLDLYPTFVELARASFAPGQPRDGVSLVNAWQPDSQAEQREALHWHLPHYHHGTPASSIRRGDWKLIEFFEDETAELYHLARDPGERINLADQYPERVREFRDALRKWRLDVRARLPEPNPDYDPERAGELARPQRTNPARKTQS